MSYEYEILFNQNNSEILIGNLKKNSNFFEYKENNFEIKDEKIPSSWHYDVRVHIISNNIAIIKVVNRSEKILNELNNSLHSIKYTIKELGDDEGDLSLRSILHPG
jgi:hypothetical protein